MQSTKAEAEKVLAVVPNLRREGEERRWDRGRKAQYNERLAKYEQRIGMICLDYQILISDCKSSAEAMSNTRENVGNPQDKS